MNNELNKYKLISAKDKNGHEKDISDLFINEHKIGYFVEYPKVGSPLWFYYDDVPNKCMRTSFITDIKNQLVINHGDTETGWSIQLIITTENSIYTFREIS